MRYFRSLLILIFCYTTASAQTDSVYTLQQCIDIAIKNNLDVKKSELQMERQRIYYQQARENLLPTLNGNADHQFSEGRSQGDDGIYRNDRRFSGSYSINSGVVLSNGLSLTNSIKQTSLAYQAGQMDYQQAKNNISLNVITTYLQVLSNQDQLTQAQNQFDISKKQLERQEVLNKDGNIQPQQLFDLRGEFATSKLGLVSSQNAIYASKLDLLQIMNVPFNKEVKLQRLAADEVPGVYNLTSDQIYNSALNDFALVRSTALRVKSAEKGVAATKGNLFPTLSLRGGLSTVYFNTAKGGFLDQVRGGNTTGLGLGLSIPILNNFQTRNRVSLAKIDLQDAANTDNATRVRLKQQIERAYVDMTSAYERYQILTDQVNAYSESFRIAEVKFTEGVLNSVDYLTAKGNMDRSKISWINARYDYFIRTKILDYYQGKMAF